MKILLAIFIFVTICCLLLRVYGSKREHIKCDALIILGAGLYGDRISRALKRRLDAGIEYANEFDVPIIVTGGQGKDELVSEASAMKKYLVSQGIDENRILMEDKSTSTYENFKFSKQLYLHDQSEVMVTSCDFHMYRSIHMAKDAKLIPHRFPAKSTTLNSIKFYYREVFCILKYFITKD